MLPVWRVRGEGEMTLLRSLAGILWCYLILPSRSPENILAALFSPRMAPCKPGENSGGVGVKGKGQASTYPLSDAALTLNVSFQTKAWRHKLNNLFKVSGLLNVELCFYCSHTAPGNDHCAFQDIWHMTNEVLKLSKCLLLLNSHQTY